MRRLVLGGGTAGVSSRAAGPAVRGLDRIVFADWSLTADELLASPPSAKSGVAPRP